MTDVLKVLCLHGYRQNDQTFRERTGALRKIIKKHADLVFISAPNVVPPLVTEGEEEQAGNNTDQRGWWFSTNEDTYKAQDVTDCSKGFSDSVEVIKKAFIEQGPFDGVLAFSQGASMLSLICGLKEEEPDGPIQFDFAIVVAGYKSRQTTHSHLYSKSLKTPSLHVFGDTDKVIPKDMSEDLLQYFENPTVLQHTGGHFIPASGPQKKVYIKFLEEFLAKKRTKTAS